MPKRIITIGLILCALGGLSAWQLMAIIDRHDLRWNPAGFLLPLGVVLVFVKRTQLTPGAYPKVLLSLGAIFTLMGFFAMVGNFSQVIEHGEMPQVGTILLPLGGGLIFGRAFCRAFVKLLVYMSMVAVAAGWSVDLINEKFSDPEKIILPPLLIGALIVADRVLYSQKSNEYFRHKA